ncbi:MAG: HAMP domain-containing histidine kinase [Hyphomicrobiales bacterium]|nr:HAMP domain-containing histidine kinase [Hyphomicrobiales bacterium]
MTTEDPVWVWDVGERRVLWANHPARAFWGVTSLDALQARRFSPRSHFASRLSYLAAPPRNLTEGTEELCIPAVSGKKTVQCYLLGLQVAGGRPGFIIKALGSATDGVLSVNTGRNLSKANRVSAGNADSFALQAIAKGVKNASKRRKTPQTQSVKPTDAKPSTGEDALSSAVRELGHELGNPLNVIRGFAGWIKEIAPTGRDHDRLCSYADNIVEAADLAMDVFANFSARFAEGERGIRIEPAADVRDIVERCQALVAPLARDSGVRVVRRVEGILPSLYLSSGGLQQILMNLLINAIRYHKSGRKIRIAARQNRSGELKLSVSDDGRGMSKKAIAVAIGKSKGRSSAKNGRTGGVGLPLVRRIVEDAGGRMTIESARGKGTRITIIFPPATHAS